MKGNHPILIPLCTVKQRNAVMRNWVTCLKPCEELVAESEADPNYPLPGLSTEIMPFLLTVDECENSSWWSWLSLCNGPGPCLATDPADREGRSLILWGGLGLHPVHIPGFTSLHIECITLPKVSASLIPQWFSSGDSVGEAAPVSVDNIKFQFRQFEVCRRHRACYRNDVECRTL